MSYDEFAPLQTAAHDGREDFFMIAAAPFPDRRGASRNLAPLTPQSMQLTHANVLAHCLRETAGPTRLSDLAARATAATAGSAGSYSPLPSPYVTRSSASKEAVSDEGTAAAYLPAACVSQRLSYVADITARVQGGAGQRGRRSPSVHLSHRPCSLSSSAEAPAEACATRGIPCAWRRASTSRHHLPLLDIQKRTLSPSPRQSLQMGNGCGTAAVTRHAVVHVPSLESE